MLVTLHIKVRAISVCQHGTNIVPIACQYRPKFCPKVLHWVCAALAHRARVHSYGEERPVDAVPVTVPVSHSDVTQARVGRTTL